MDALPAKVRKGRNATRLPHPHETGKLVLHGLRDELQEVEVIFESELAHKDVSHHDVLLLVHCGELRGRAATVSGARGYDV